jgi:hypothetical protein
MRKIIVTAVASFSAVLSACAQPSADQRELARVHWLPAIKEIIVSGDLADYQYVAKQFNLTLESKPPMPVRNLDEKVVGESFDIEMIPPANFYDNGKIGFHYGIYEPNEKSYKRAILTVRNIEFGECVTESNIQEIFGVGKRTGYPKAGQHSVDFSFKGDNLIDLYFIFSDVKTKCAQEISIFQNRWK